VTSASDLFAGVQRSNSAFPVSGLDFPAPRILWPLFGLTDQGSILPPRSLIAAPVLASQRSRIEPARNQAVNFARLPAGDDNSSRLP
jgi:hypothetical protein